jgi:hypothetical protein
MDYYLLATTCINEPSYGKSHLLPQQSIRDQNCKHAQIEKPGKRFFPAFFNAYVLKMLTICAHFGL